MAQPRLAHATNRPISSTLGTSPSHGPSPPAAPRPFSDVLAYDALLSDHEGDLGEAVRKGRREEFKTFAAFADPIIRDAIPDPQAASTFEQSKLRWEERSEAPHARVLALYKALFALRRTDPVLGAEARWEDCEVRAENDVLEVVRRQGSAKRSILVNFGRTEHAVVTTGASPRVLVASGSFEGGKLAARSAVVLATG